MNLEGILNISGKPGLFKIISTGNNKIIVESLTDGKRSPIHSNYQVNMLEEIGIYTYEDTKPLSDIFDLITKKEAGKETISHKSSKDDLTNYFREVVDNYDEERVYISDIKKVIQWYNLMQNVGLIEEPKKKKPSNKKKKEPSNKKKIKK